MVFFPGLQPDITGNCSLNLFTFLYSKIHFKKVNKSLKISHAILFIILFIYIYNSKKYYIMHIYFIMKKFKRSSRLLLAVLAIPVAFTFTSCTEEEDVMTIPPKDRLKVPPSYSMEAGSLLLHV